MNLILFWGDFFFFWLYCNFFGLALIKKKKSQWVIFFYVGLVYQGTVDFLVELMVRWEWKVVGGSRV